MCSPGEKQQPQSNVSPVIFWKLEFPLLKCLIPLLILISKIRNLLPNFWVYKTLLKGTAVTSTCSRNIQHNQKFQKSCGYFKTVTQVQCQASILLRTTIHVNLLSDSLVCLLFLSNPNGGDIVSDRRVTPSINATHGCLTSSVTTLSMCCS